METTKFKVGDNVRLTAAAIRQCQKMFGLDAQWSEANRADVYVVKDIHLTPPGEHNTIDVQCTAKDEIEQIAECFLCKTAPKVYPVKVRFVFDGTFFIKANSKSQAKEFADNHCGMVTNNGIHSTLPDEDVDWDFPVHPQKIIR